MSSKLESRPASRALSAVALQSRVPGTSPATVTRRTAAAGIVVHHVTVAPLAAYNYAGKGTSHYLAHHELRLLLWTDLHEVSYLGGTCNNGGLYR